MKELLERLRAGSDNEEFLALVEEIENKHNSVVTDFETFKDGSASTLSERDSREKELSDEITRLKAKNFDLLMGQAVDSEPNPGDNEGNDEDDPEPGAGGIDALFKETE